MAADDPAIDIDEPPAAGGDGSVNDLVQRPSRIDAGGGSSRGDGSVSANPGTLNDLVQRPGQDDGPQPWMQPAQGPQGPPQQPQFPGQGQQPPPGFGQQQPSLGQLAGQLLGLGGPRRGGPMWQGRAQPSWPPPWRPARSQRYIPNLPNRPWQQWGQPREWMSTPKRWEVPGIFMGLGAQLQRYGSGMVAPMGANLGIFSGAWMKGYMEGQQQLASLRHQQMADQASALDDQMTKELDDYQKTFREFADPDNPDSWSDPKVSARLEQALYAVASKYNDQHMLSALANNHIQGVINILRWMDAKHGDLRSANKTLQEETKENERLAPWRAPGAKANDPMPPLTTGGGNVPTGPDYPGDTGGDEAPAADGPAPALKPAAPAATPSNEPALDIGAAGSAGRPGVQLAMAGDSMSDAPMPGMQRLAANGAPPLPGSPQETWDPPESGALQQGWTKFHLDPNTVNAAALDIVHGTLKTGGSSSIPKEVQPYVQARAEEIKDDMRRIGQWAQSHPNFRGGKVLDAVGKVDPEFASQLRAYVSGSAPVPTSNRTAPMLGFVVALGQYVDPSFNAQQAQGRYKELQELTKGTTGRALASGVTALDHVDLLREKIKGLPDFSQYGPLAAKMMSDFISGVMPRIPGVTPEQWSQWQIAIQEYEGIVTLVAPEVARTQVGGKPTEGGIHEMEKVLGASANPKVREDMLNYIQGLAWHRIKNTANQAAELLNQKDAQGRPDPTKVLSVFDRFMQNPTFSGGKGAENDYSNPYAGGRSVKGTMQRVLNGPDDPPPVYGRAVPFATGPGQQQQAPQGQRIPQGMSVPEILRLYQKPDVSVPVILPDGRQKWLPPANAR